ncbi:hypothetical protein N7462_001694 [Penicillium macrosclerotiorum]|uniref:uncharacterized protein n=1 Tax=Penicillium macrosclerotiorum TaxID=303699 RepID=UPI0025492EBB|nr:uncharacterized protein N7462_001694 [Penicillium macrosclerotiorum]KAJ5692271.1 hypothetical protein N7462_001694 [Penicillium macrosclerotiorum]
MFIADRLGRYDINKGSANVIPALASEAQFPVNNPLYPVPPMAAVTKNLIFGAAASLTYAKPYALSTSNFQRWASADPQRTGNLDSSLEEWW